MSMDVSRRDFPRPIGLDAFLDILLTLNLPIPIFGRLGIASINNKRRKPSTRKRGNRQNYITFE